MCKTWKIRYACAHIFPFRLSTCNGTFSRINKTKADCGGSSYLTLHSEDRCGACQKTTAEDELAKFKEDMQDQLNTDSPELAAAEAKCWREEKRLDTGYFGKQHKKNRALPKNRPIAVEKCFSPLKYEVMPQDIMVEREEDAETWTKTTNGDRWANWDTVYAQLSDNIEGCQGEEMDTTYGVSTDTDVATLEEAAATAGEEQAHIAESMEDSSAETFDQDTCDSNVPSRLVSDTKREATTALDIITIVVESKMVEERKPEARRILTHCRTMLKSSDTAKLEVEIRELAYC